VLKSRIIGVWSWGTPKAMGLVPSSGALSGGLCAREKPETPKGNCVFLFVCDPDKFGGRAHFAAEVDQMMNFVRSCPRAEGVNEILLPGDPERRCRQDRLTKGIPLDEENWARLLELAQDLTLPPPSLDT
jgi:hydroxycarboxylate dehydrogenase B